MNRIYIIGNGFDLSHGLPTSYKDFIEFLIKKEVTIFIDLLINTQWRINNNIFIHDFLGKLIPTDIEMSLIYKKKIIYGGFSENEKNYLKKIKNEFYHEPLKAHKKYFIINNNNEFYKKILDSDNLFWGKIEIQYFELLKKYHKLINEDFSNLDLIKDFVEMLNKNLTFIKNELVFYLKYIQENNNIDYTKSEVCAILNEKINLKTSEIILRKKENIKINDKILQNLFLNFNYTDTFSYLTNREGFNYSCINIHGNIKESNEVIFGYGDENTNEYREIENSEDVFLENIKSFKYLKNNNYDLLTNYIDSDYYEVYLLGHSCSVTDRVLLKKIFEHKNCLTIKIIPRHGDDDERLKNYKEISFNIARIFDDNGLMRDKMISFEDCKNSLPKFEKHKVIVFEFLKTTKNKI